MLLFTRQIYFNVLEESIEYCRAEKGMEVFAYCFMPSHVHLIFRSSNEDPSALVRDFKEFTARKMIKTIEGNPQESRKEWLLWMMERVAKKKSNVKQRQFWQQHNKPIELWSDWIFRSDRAALFGQMMPL